MIMAKTNSGSVQMIKVMIMLSIFSQKIFYSFSNKFQDTKKQHNKSLQKQSRLLNVTDVTSDAENHF